MSNIHLISGPRNISTALMYAFDNRKDTEGVDEPMYAHYLSKHDVDHPGKEEVLKNMEKDADQLMMNLHSPSKKTTHRFIKNMAHHLADFPMECLLPLKNVFLIRDPAKVIVSFKKVMPNFTADEIGIRQQFEMYTFLKEQQQEILVINSDYLLEDPKTYLRLVCHQLDLTFSEEMLHWEAGAREIDGVWAKYWYDNVHRSRGFIPKKNEGIILPSNLQELFNEVQDYYISLNKHSIRI